MSKLYTHQQEYLTPSLERWFDKHLNAVYAELLCNPEAIAKELAYRDMQLEKAQDHIKILERNIEMYRLRKQREKPVTESQLRATAAKLYGKQLHNNPSTETVPPLAQFLNEPSTHSNSCSTQQTHSEPSHSYDSGSSSSSSSSSCE